MWPYLLGGLAIFALAAGRGRRGRSYFSIAELSHSDKADELGIDNTPGSSAVSNLNYGIENLLDPWRREVGKLDTSSGFRNSTVNRAVGGDDDSHHLKGNAWDGFAADMDEDDAFAELYELDQDGDVDIDKAILYHPDKGGHVHISWSRRGDDARHIFMYQPASGDIQNWTP